MKLIRTKEPNPICPECGKYLSFNANSSISRLFSIYACNNCGSKYRGGSE